MEQSTGIEPASPGLPGARPLSYDHNLLSAEHETAERPAPAGFFEPGPEAERRPRRMPANEGECEAASWPLRVLFDGNSPRPLPQRSCLARLDMFHICPYMGTTNELARRDHIMLHCNQMPANRQARPVSLAAFCLQMQRALQCSIGTRNAPKPQALDVSHEVASRPL